MILTTEFRDERYDPPCRTRRGFAHAAAPSPLAAIAGRQPRLVSVRAPANRHWSAGWRPSFRQQQKPTS